MYKVRCGGGCDIGVHGEAPQRCSSTEGTSCAHCGVPTPFWGTPTNLHNNNIHQHNYTLVVYIVEKCYTVCCAYKVGKKSHPAPKGFLNKVGPNGLKFTSDCLKLVSVFFFFAYCHSICYVIVVTSLMTLFFMNKFYKWCHSSLLWLHPFLVYVAS